MIALLFLFPLIATGVAAWMRNRTVNIAAMVIYTVIVAISTASLFVRVSTSGEALYAYANYIRIDHLNLLFLGVLAVLLCGVTLYSIDYLRREHIDRNWHTSYVVCLMLFVASMIGVLLSNHLGLLWVFVEATTLCSAPFICFERSETSLEAVWKYLFICSVGIAFAFVGVIFLATGTGHLGEGETASLFLDTLYAGADKITPFSLRLAFPFFLIGFGTKIGLAPIHAWLPDAHAEAPSPISALLSGSLLNSALLAVLRILKLMDAAQMGTYARTMLLIMGFLSLFVSAIYLVRVGNYKRMLAYSSIENMGVIAIGVGLGGLGTFAAMLHVIAHSLSKASFFMTAGNIYEIFHTKKIADISALLRRDCYTGWLWILCLLALIGFPPFPVFLSEFFMVKAMLAQHQFGMLALFAVLLTITMVGLVRFVLQMSFGGTRHPEGRGNLGVLSYVPQFVFLALLAALGLSLPSHVEAFLEAAKNSL